MYYDHRYWTTFNDSFRVHSLCRYYSHTSIFMNQPDPFIIILLITLITGVVVFLVGGGVRLAIMYDEYIRKKQRALISRTIKLSPAYRKEKNIKDLYAQISNTNEYNTWEIRTLASRDTIKEAKAQYDKEFNSSMEQYRKEKKKYDVLVNFTFFFSYFYCNLYFQLQYLI